MIDIDKLRQALGAVQPEEVEELLDRLEAAEKEREIDEQRIADLMAELNRVGHENDALRALVVMRFDHAHPPQFTQGYAPHELTEPVTAEHCRWFVDEIERLRSKIAEMERQAPAAEVESWTNGSYSRNYKLRWLKDVAEGDRLYALPGAQPAPSVPEDVMRDAERYRYLRARDDGTAGVGCWIEAEGRACDRGWLYGVQLDSAIDTCIEMLAAAPEAKP